MLPLFIRPRLLLGTAIVLSGAPAVGWAQDAGPKPRLELADSTRQVRPPAATDDRSGMAARSALTVANAPDASAAPRTIVGSRSDLVRNQSVLGAVLYAPAFASTVARDPLLWTASYLLVAGGSYVAAAGIARDLTVTDPMQRLATGLPIRGAIAGSMVAGLLKADTRGTAGAILFSSVAGTTAALWRGRTMNDAEAAATLFGSDVFGLAGYGLATAAGLRNDGSPNPTRLWMALGGMVAGAPLGQAYAALAPYNVSVGDLYAMSAVAGVGMLAGFTTIAGGAQTEREIGAGGTIGALAGLLVGDRLLARRYDHTPREGQLMMAGGAAGGLVGAGVALLTRAQQERWATYSGALSTVGAALGVAWTQHYLRPKGDGTPDVGALSLSPVGVVAAATGMRGSYTIGSIRF